MQNDKDFMEAVHLYPLKSALGESRSDMHSKEETNMWWNSNSRHSARTASGHYSDGQVDTRDDDDGRR